MIYLGSVMKDTEVDDKLEELQENLFDTLYAYFETEHSRQVDLFYLTTQFLKSYAAGVQILCLGDNECYFSFLRDEDMNDLLVVYLNAPSKENEYSNTEYCGVAIGCHERLWELVVEYLEKYYSLKIFSSKFPLSQVYQQVAHVLGDNPLEHPIFDNIIDEVIYQELERTMWKNR